MIARTCGVANATVKVHMKSILRKIRVAESDAGSRLGARAGLRCLTDGRVQRADELRGSPPVDLPTAAMGFNAPAGLVFSSPRLDTLTRLQSSAA